MLVQPLLDRLFREPHGAVPEFQERDSALAHGVVDPADGDTKILGERFGRPMIRWLFVEPILEWLEAKLTGGSIIRSGLLKLAGEVGLYFKKRLLRRILAEDCLPKCIGGKVTP